jgi:hypothetical protein
MMHCAANAVYRGHLSDAVDWTGLGWTGLHSTAAACVVLRITADTSLGPSQLGWDCDGSSNASHENG